jgi:hypothetical protein
MKLLLTPALFLLTACSVLAQSTAQDFYKDDCDGNSHHLFAELNAGYAVLIEFAMIPTCQPCISAGKKVENLKATVDAQHPGQVKWYIMEFSGQFTCSQLESWKSTHGISSTGFAGGNTEVDYYGGMGMPTFVLLGGADHAVLWKKLGNLSTSDTIALKTTLDAFFAASGTHEADAGINVQLSPNPASAALQLTVAPGPVTIDRIEIVDPAGTRLLTGQWPGAATMSVDVSSLPAGLYVISFLNDRRGQVGAQRFIKD